MRLEETGIRLHQSQQWHFAAGHVEAIFFPRKGSWQCVLTNAFSRIMCHIFVVSSLDTGHNFRIQPPAPYKTVTIFYLFIVYLMTLCDLVEENHATAYLCRRFSDNNPIYP